MLQELQTVAQREKDILRRWFEDDYFDLIIWHDLANNIEGFQLCYNKYRDEHALTWSAKNGFKHDKIDDGRNPGHAAASPVLVEAVPFKWEMVIVKFKKRSETIEKRIRELVLEKMEEFSYYCSSMPDGGSENTQVECC